MDRELLVAHLNFLLLPVLGCVDTKPKKKKTAPPSVCVPDVKERKKLAR